MTPPTALDLAYTPELSGMEMFETGDFFAKSEKWQTSLKMFQPLAEKGSLDATINAAFCCLELKDYPKANYFASQVLLAEDHGHSHHAFAWNLLGLIGERTGKLTWAEENYATAIRLCADNPAFYINQAHLLQIMGRYEEAIAAYERVMALNPAHMLARFYRSMALLTLGRFEEGFKEYELRYAVYGSPVPINGKRIWRGQESLAGKTVLICAEQGIGDAIQFARYARWLKCGLKAKTVIALARADLQPILGCIEGIDGVIDGPLLDYDFHVPMASLPGLSLHSDPKIPRYGRCPYLHVPRLKHDHPTQLALQAEKLRVGFCYRGNRAHNNDRYRSIDFKLFKPLIEMAGILPINLQHDETIEGMANPEIGGILSLAQVIQELDLIITVDTAIAHIAGALGKRVWVLLPLNQDWRWGLTGVKTPWYPSMRLFRARKPLRWEPVIDRVKRALGSARVPI